MDCGYCLMILVSIPVILYALYLYIASEISRRKFARWDNTPKDKLILHGYPRGRTIPTVSPWLFKVETYLRLNKIEYTLDTTDIFGPKGKTPWISYNGMHLGDSEFIIDFLNKKFEKNMNTNGNEIDLANARILRIVTDEYLSLALGLERVMYGNKDRLTKVLVADKFRLPLLLFPVLKWVVKKRLYDQGIGRHTQEESTLLLSKVLKSASVALGDRKYFGGNEICQEDCGIFGMLSECLWGLPESPYEALMNGEECKNLKNYCLRIKERAWPDWDDLLAP